MAAVSSHQSAATAAKKGGVTWALGLAGQVAAPVVLLAVGAAIGSHGSRLSKPRYVAPVPPESRAQPDHGVLGTTPGMFPESFIVGDDGQCGDKECDLGLLCCPGGGSHTSICADKEHICCQGSLGPVFCEEGGTCCHNAEGASYCCSAGHRCHEDLCMESIGHPWGDAVLEAIHPFLETGLKLLGH
eukprot:TRINITY_DN18011_c0_g1_i1.p1 TRINITY_DN18011_c0_g1~~TRINITY_DN18011_c0_g1_i1.p1  ORF type:complete len:187 (-),score=48.36 TRINITY_DN18011_c0_g1_i1:146-706(-)